MKNIISALTILFFSLQCAAQQVNDDCAQATVIQNVSNYCSADREFSTSDTKDGDVWFQFTARAFDVNISVSGNLDGSGMMGGTMQVPAVDLYSGCTGPQIVTSKVSSDNVTSLYKGGLIIGTIYYIRVSGGINGSFRLCVNNFNPILKPGQDCSSASVLCSKETFTQNDVSGGGLNSDEAAGTCLGAFGVNSEQNSAWYKWTAANNGSLTFVITPTANDDIDWVLYDLGTADNCAAISQATAVRCDAGRGVDCFGPGQKRYTKTGLNLTSTDLFEAGGCFEGQDGFVRYLDMQQGHIYALVVNNFDRGNNGFTIEFGGTGEFLGPLAQINLQENEVCTPEQTFTFTSQSSNYDSLKWTFGEGASLDSSNAEGPVTISYTSPGLKTVVLQAFGDNNCSVIATKTFQVNLKPEMPVISVNQEEFCLNETIELSTPAITGASYTWTGPAGFSSKERIVSIPVTANSVSGDYSLVVSIGRCSSDPALVTIPPVSQTPVISLDVFENNPCTPESNYTINFPAVNYEVLIPDFGPGAIVNSGSGNGPYTVSYNTPGIRQVTITATGSSGCVVTISKLLDVPVIPPRPIIRQNKDSFCVNDTIFLNTPERPNTTYVWSGPNNYTSSGTSVSILVTGENVAGQYTLTATEGRCSSEAAVVIIPAIIKRPVAAFTSDPVIPAKVVAPASVQFTNKSRDADSYFWDFGDGTTSTEENPVHVYSTFGKFDVTLTAIQSSACSTSVMKGQLFISADNKIFIPNTFTPNADQVNDEFVVSMSNISSYRLQIFNRYGSPIFQASDIFENWKGVYKNAPLPVGTYFYIIDAVSLSGEPIKKSGTISIIK